MAPKRKIVTKRRPRGSNLLDASKKTFVDNSPGSQDVEMLSEDDARQSPKTMMLISGNNDCGQLGSPDEATSNNRFRFIALDDFSRKVTDCAAGGVHSLILTENGKVYSFGDNEMGQLGSSSERIPRLVSFKGVRVVKITAGETHSVALSDDGKVFFWGKFRQEDRPFERPAEASGHRPRKLAFPQPVKDIASGDNHVLIIDIEGDIYSFGISGHGRLGRIRNSHCCLENRRAFEVMLFPNKINAMRKRKRVKFTAIWAGGPCSFARSDDGSIWGCGRIVSELLETDDLRDTYAVFLMTQLDFFDPLVKWTRLCAGEEHILALDDNGNLYAMGQSLYGRLGYVANKNESRVYPLTRVMGLAAVKVVDIAAGPRCSFAVDSEGRLWSWGQGDDWIGHGTLKVGQDVVHPTICTSPDINKRKVSKVSAGSQHTICITTDDRKPRITGREL